MKYPVIVCIFMLLASVQTGCGLPSPVLSRWQPIQQRNVEESASRPIRLNRDVEGTVTLDLVEGEPEKIHYANRNQYPFMMALFEFKKTGFRFACGGSLISANKILTAAHCVTHKRTRNTIALDHLKIKLGMHFLNTTSDDAQLTMNVTDIKIHEAYNPKTKINNIAILTLESDVEFTETISPVCLMPNDYYDYNDLFTTMGWINRPSEWNNTDYLWHSKTQVWANAIWQEDFTELDIKLTDAMLLAFWFGEYACRNDDGSPMVVELWNVPRANFQGGCRNMQVGIVSIGHGCPRRKLAGIYTRVEMYMGWIRANAPDVVIASLPIRERGTPDEGHATIDP